VSYGTPAARSTALTAFDDSVLYRVLPFLSEPHTPQVEPSRFSVTCASARLATAEEYSIRALGADSISRRRFLQQMIESGGHTQARTMLVVFQNLAQQLGNLQRAMDRSVRSLLRRAVVISSPLGFTVLRRRALQTVSHSDSALQPNPRLELHREGHTTRHLVEEGFELTPRLAGTRSLAVSALQRAIAHTRGTAAMPELAVVERVFSRIVAMREPPKSSSSAASLSCSAHGTVISLLHKRVFRQLDEIRLRRGTMQSRAGLSSKSKSDILRALGTVDAQGQKTSLSAENAQLAEWLRITGYLRELELSEYMVITREICARSRLDRAKARILLSVGRVAYWDSRYVVAVHSRLGGRGAADTPVAVLVDVITAEHATKDLECRIHGARHVDACANYNDSRTTGSERFLVRALTERDWVQLLALAPQLKDVTARIPFRALFSLPVFVSESEFDAVRSDESNRARPHAASYIAAIPHLGYKSREDLVFSALLLPQRKFLPFSHSHVVAV